MAGEGGHREEGRTKNEERRTKNEERRGKREEGRGKREEEIKVQYKRWGEADWGWSLHFAIVDGLSFDLRRRDRDNARGEDFLDR
jgi:hypothetical protein